MENFIKNLYNAEKSIRTADHLIYVTFPLVNDKKLLIKILLEIKKAMASCISSILQYEDFYKRIKLSQDPKINLNIFFEKSSKKYNLSNYELSQIKEIFDLTKKHRESPMEFVRGNKLIILSDDLSNKIITPEKTKEFLELTKTIFRKHRQTVIQN